MLKRRDFILQIGAILGSTALSGFAFTGSQAKTSKKILLVSGWQDVNIGDIAHTPGLLHILENYLPKTEIILWKKSKATPEVYELLTRNFPKVKIINGEVDSEGNVNSEEVKRAFNEADLMIHGSGPSVVGQPHLEAWFKQTKKPFGIFGVTIQNIDERLKALLSQASFIYTRETASLSVLEKAGLKGNSALFAPDATFYLDLKNDEKANASLREKNLEPGKFICAVPRLRYTPYHQFSKVNWSAERIEMVERVNSENKEKDHAKLREAMIAWVRETGNKVLVCPEMTYAIDIMDELLIDPLPEDVKPFVVKRGYWLPDEAASVYAKSFAVLSFECHSPIIAAANGIPFFYLRQPEDTIKGQMYYDLHFNNWVFEIDQTDGKEIAQRLREVWQNYDKAKNEIKVNMKEVDQIYKNRVGRIKDIG